MESYLATLYRVEELLQTAVVSREHYVLEEALQLLSGMISELELSHINDEEDEDENYIPEV